MIDNQTDSAAAFEACCDHCGCPPGERVGHDDTCRFGCNDGPTTAAEKGR